MKLSPFLCLVFAIMVLAACKKEKSEEGPLQSHVCNYSPYTTGSSFNYEFVNVNPPMSGDFVLLVKGDSVIGNESYRVLEDDITGEFSLFDCGNGDYVQLLAVTGIPNAPTQPIKTTYLKENVPLGQGWSEDIPITITGLGDFMLHIRYTIIQKGSNKTVLGKAYTNVIGVEMEVSVPPFILPQILSTNYYAKGVGLIELDRFEDTTRLRTYNIKP